MTFTLPRQHTTWLWANLVDATIFAGAPVVALAAWRCMASLFTPRWWDDPTSRLRLSIISAILLLDISGTTRGEVGRIWVPMMPMMYLGLVSQSNDGSSTPTVTESLILGTLVAAFTIVLALRWAS